MILIVEDSRLQALQLQQVLEQCGHATALAANGREGLAFLKQFRTTPITSDIVMPEMDGYAMCHAIKHDPSLQAVPVVLLTNLSDPEDIIQGLRSKADCCLTKPYNRDY